MSEPTVAASDNSAAIAGLAQSASKRVQKLMGAYLLGSTAYRAGRSVWNRLHAELSHTITVDSRDDLYPDVMAWLYDTIPEEKRRSLKVSSTGDSRSVDVSPTSEPQTAKLRLHYDGKRAQTVHINGHRVRVEVETDTDPGRSPDGGYTYKVDKITFTATDVDGRSAVLDFLARAAATRVRTGPRLYIGTRWGDWRRVGGVPLRDFATVALPAGLEADIVGDLEAFLSQEEDYARLGLPWHRGFVLHGPPGSGKTTIAKALASRFDMDLYFVPLADVEDDSSLMQMFAALAPRSMLLLEDVDINVSARERTDQGKGVSMSALLQSLDGIVTPQGLVTVMTTNRIEDLDPALIRPGRGDRVFAVSYLTDDQLVVLVENLTGLRRTLPPLNGRQITPAEIVEVLKHHIGRPATGVEAVAGYVEARALETLG